MPKKRLGDLLIDAGLISPLQLRSALAEQKHWGKPLGRTLVEMEMIAEPMMIKVLSQQLGVPAIELDKSLVNDKAARKLTEPYCRDMELIAFAFHEKGRFLDVAMANPTDPAVFDHIRVETHCNVRPYLAGPLAISRAINRVFVGKRVGDGSSPEVVGETTFEFDRPKSGSLVARRERPESLEVQIDFDRETPQPELAVDVKRSSAAKAAGVQFRAAPSSVDAAIALPPIEAPPSSEDLADPIDLSSEVAQLKADMFEVRNFVRKVDQQLRALTEQLERQGVLSSEDKLPSVSKRPRIPTEFKRPSSDRLPGAAARGNPESKRSEMQTPLDLRAPLDLPPPKLDRPRPARVASSDVPPPPVGIPARAIEDTPELPPTKAFRIRPPTEDVRPVTSPARTRPPTDEAPARVSNDLPPVSGTIDVPDVPTGAVVAMDFGTSRSSVATVVDGKVVSVDLRGEWDMPSVVAFEEDGSVILGQAAREMLATDPRCGVPWPKRLVGRQFGDRDLEPYLANMAVPCTEGPHKEIMLHVHDKAYRVEELCSHVLRRLKLAAEHTICRPVTDVVLTTPVSYDKPQYDALTEAASIAGLKVAEFIDEPVAAAFTNRGHPSFDGLVAVFDFGGGTFDFSVVEVSDDGVSVVISAGDPWLGGDDFDEALANSAANAFWRKTNIELRNQIVEWQRLLISAEKTKRELSTEQQAVLYLKRAARVPQGMLDLEFTITQPEFAHLSRDIIQRSIDTCEEALSFNGIKVSELNAVYLSGGTSYVPAVREGIGRFFGSKPHVTVPPERAVILGAALFAAVLKQPAAKG